MAEPLTALVLLVHVGLLGGWLGSMLYSLVIVQPRAARFFAGDDDGHEAFLIMLGAGNRRPVLAIIGVVLATGAILAVVAPVEPGLVVLEGALVVTAALAFGRVSWQLWPRRVVARAAERPAYRAALRRHAVALVALVGAAFSVAVIAVHIG